MQNIENMSEEPATRVTRSQKRLNSNTPPEVVPLKAFNKITDKDYVRSPVTRARRSSTVEAMNSTPILNSPVRRLTRRNSLTEALTPQPSPIRRSRRLSTNFDEPSTPSKTLRVLRGRALIEQVPEEENVKSDENSGQKTKNVEKLEKIKFAANSKNQKDNEDENIEKKNGGETGKTTDDEKKTPSTANSVASKTKDENTIELDSNEQCFEKENQLSVTTDESVSINPKNQLSITIGESNVKPDITAELKNEKPIEEISEDKPNQRADENSNTKDRIEEDESSYRKSETTPIKEKDKITEGRNEEAAKEIENRRDEPIPDEKTSTTIDNLNSTGESTTSAAPDRIEEVAKETSYRKDETTPRKEKDELAEGRNEEVAKEIENRRDGPTPVEKTSTTKDNLNSTGESTTSAAPEKNNSAEKRKTIEFAKSWSQPVIVKRKTSNESGFIDGITVKQRTPNTEVTPNKKTSASGKKLITKRVAISSNDESENSEAENARNEFLDSEAIDDEDSLNTSEREFLDIEAREATDDKDSLNTIEREYLEQNEVSDTGESIGSEDTDELTDPEDSECLSSFVVSEEEVEKLSDSDEIYDIEKKPYRRITARSTDSSSDDGIEKNKDSEKTDSKLKSIGEKSKNHNNTSSVQYISSDKIDENTSSDENGDVTNLSQVTLDSSVSIDTASLLGNEEAKNDKHSFVKNIADSPKHVENENKSKIDSLKDEDNEKESSLSKKPSNTSSTVGNKPKIGGRIQTTLNESTKALIQRQLKRNSNILDESSDDYTSDEIFQKTKFMNPTPTDLNSSKKNADKSLSKEISNSKINRSKDDNGDFSKIANDSQKSLKELNHSPSSPLNIEKKINTSQKSKIQKLNSSKESATTQNDFSHDDNRKPEHESSDGSDHNKSNKQENNTLGKLIDEARLSKSKSNTSLQKLSKDVFAEKSFANSAKKEKSRIQDLNKSKLSGKDSDTVSDESDFDNAEMSNAEDFSKSGNDRSTSIQSDKPASDAEEEEENLDEEPEENSSDLEAEIEEENLDEESEENSSDREAEIEEESSDRVPEETTHDTSKGWAMLLVEKLKSAEKATNRRSSLKTRHSLSLSKNLNVLDGETEENTKSEKSSKRNKSLPKEFNISKKNKSLMAGNTPARQNTSHLGMSHPNDISSDNASSGEEYEVKDPEKSTNRRSSLKIRQSLNLPEQSNKLDTGLQENTKSGKRHSLNISNPKEWNIKNSSENASSDEEDEVIEPERNTNRKSSLQTRQSLYLSRQSSKLDTNLQVNTRSGKRLSLNKSTPNKSLTKECNIKNAPANASSEEEEDELLDPEKSTSSLKTRKSLNLSKQSNKLDTDLQQNKNPEKRQSLNNSKANKTLAEECNTSKKNKSVRQSVDSSLHLSMIYRNDKSTDNNSSDEATNQNNATKINATFSNGETSEDVDNANQDLSVRSEKKSNRSHVSLKIIETSSSEEDEQVLATKKPLLNTSLARSMDNKTIHSTPLPNTATKRLSVSSVENSNKKKKSSLSKSFEIEKTKGTSIEATASNEKSDIERIQDRLEAYLAAANEIKRQQKLIVKANQPKKARKIKPAKVEEIINKPIKKKTIKSDKKSEEIKKALPHVKKLLEKEIKTIEKVFAKTESNKRPQMIQDDKNVNKSTRKRTKSQSNASDQIAPENPIQSIDENISAYQAHIQNKSTKTKKNKTGMSAMKRKPVAVASTSQQKQISETTPKRSRHISTSSNEISHDEIIERPKPKSKNKKNIVTTEPSLPQDSKKKKLNILNDIPFGPFTVQPATPVSKKVVNGFLESNPTPKPIGFKVQSILSAGQKETPQVVVEKAKRRKLAKQLKITDYQPKRVWTSVGFFDVTDVENKPMPKKQQYRPDSHGASTDFVVKSLEVKKQKSHAFDESLSASALDFKKRALFNDKIKRETASELLQKKAKKQAFKKY